MESIFKGSGVALVTPFNKDGSVDYGKLKELTQSDQIILLCYEKPDDFCHRHLVAQWLTEHGYDTQEIEFDGN